MQSKLRTSGAIIAGIVAATVAPAVFAQEAPTVAPKVAVIDVVQLLEESEAGKQGIDRLKELQRRKTDERSAMQAKAADLRTKIADGQFSLATEKLDELKKELEDKVIELQRFNDDANRELEKSQQKMLVELQAKVMPIINAVGEEGGFTMIFNKFESGLVYASEAIDITADVMTRLNQAESAGDAASGKSVESGS